MNANPFPGGRWNHTGCASELVRDARFAGDREGRVSYNFRPGIG